MTLRAVNHLADEIDRLIDRTRHEYDMSYAEAVGVLAMKQHLLMEEASRRARGLTEEDEADEEPLA